MPWPKTRREIYGLAKEQAAELLNYALRKAPESYGFRKLLGKPPNQNPPKIEHLGDIDNHAQQMAAQRSLELYPEAGRMINKMSTGHDFSKVDVGGVYSRWGSFDPNIRLSGHSMYDKDAKRPDFRESMNTAAHELSHAQGYRDDDNIYPNAYDVGELTNTLYKDYGKDVNLPISSSPSWETLPDDEGGYPQYKNKASGDVYGRSQEKSTFGRAKVYEPVKPKKYGTSLYGNK